MIDLGALKIGIETDADKANKELSSVGDTVDKQESKFSSLGSGMKKGLAIGAGAVAATGAAMMGFAKKAANATDEIDKQSQKIGISRQGYQEMSYILSQNGTDIGALQRGFKTLNDRMQESIEGTGAGAEAFAMLGLSATDLNGELKTQEQMFDESARALMQMPEGAEKSALAFDLFGKAGQGLMPLLNGTEEDMDALRDAAHEMGLVLSDEAVDAGADFTDALDDLERSFGAVVAKIGVAVMPILLTLVDWIRDNIPTIRKVFESVFKAIEIVWTSVLKPVFDVLYEVMKTIVAWVNENWDTISTVFETVFTIIKAVWENILKPTLTLLWDMFKGVVQWIETNWNRISSAFETMSIAIQGIWGSIIIWVTEKFNALITWITGLKDKFMTAGKTIFTGLWDGLKNIWKSIPIWISNMMRSLIRTVTNFKSNFLQAGKDILTGLWDGIIAMKDTVVNAVKDVGNSMLSGIKGIFGIKSPSKVFHEIGENLMEGLDNGIEIAKKFPEDTLSALAKKLLGDIRELSSQLNRELEKMAEDTGKFGGIFGSGMSNIRDVGKSKSDGYDIFGSGMSNIKDEPSASDGKFGGIFGSGMSKTNTVNQTVNIHSPKALSPSETARLNKTASKQMAMGW